MEEKILQLFSFISKLEQTTQVRRKVLSDYYDFNPQKIFKLFDSKNKGFINSDDIYKYLEIHHISYTEESVQLLILFFDTDFDGVLSFQEFLPLIQNENAPMNKKNNININSNNDMSFNIEYCLTKLFEKEIELNMYIINVLCQINNSNLQEIFKCISMYKNYITSNDIRNFLDNNKIEYSESQVNDIMKRLDINKDGKIDFNEFKLLFTISNKIINNNNNDFNNINNFNNSNNDRNINSNINKNNNVNYYFDYQRNNSNVDNDDNNIKNDNNYNNSISNEFRRNMYEEDNIENEEFNGNDNYDFIKDNVNQQISSPTRNNNNNKYNNYCFTTPCCECRANQNKINDYSIGQNKYNCSINNNNQNYYFKYNTNCKDDFQNNNITYSECNDDMLNNNIPYNECNEFTNDITNNCYDESNMINNYEVPNESCYQNNNNIYTINDCYCCCNNDDTNNEFCQDFTNQEDYNNKKCQNNYNLYTPFRIGNISDTLSLRTSPRRKHPSNEHRNDNYNNRSTYFSPFHHRNPKNNGKINSNYDVDNSNNYSNSEYNFSYKPINVKRTLSQHNLRINRDNIAHNYYNNNYSNSDNNNNSFVKDKKILSNYFKLAMEGESQIELTKVNLLLRKDFNCINFFNLFDEENKGFITFDDLKNELEFIGLPMKDIEIQLLINRFNRTNNNNNNEEENIIEFENFCCCLLPSSNKYEDLCNEKIKNRNTNESNVFSPTTRLYFKTLIKAMADLEKKLNKYKKQNINKDINLIDVLKEIDVSEKGYFGINELIRFLKEHKLYSCYKDAELLFKRLDKNERNKVSYEDIFTDLSYL